MNRKNITSMVAAATVFGLTPKSEAVVTYIGGETIWSMTSGEAIPGLVIAGITDDPVIPPALTVPTLVFVTTTGNGADASIYVNWSGSGNTYQYFLSGVTPGRYESSDPNAVQDFLTRANDASGSKLSGTFTDYTGANTNVNGVGLNVVPEPSTLGLAAGAFAFGALRRNRKGQGWFRAA